MIKTKIRPGGRRYQIGFSASGCLLIILFFAFINYTTGARFPWFIFPSYAALWWPLLTIFRGRHSMRRLSLIGSALTIIMLFFINYLTSWGYPWFIFPSFALLWWPIGMYFGTAHAKTLSIAGSAALIVTLTAINLIVSPAHIWFYIPAFAIVWWPLSVMLARPGAIAGYSAVGAAIIIAFLTLTNFLESPSVIWAPLAYFPALMWPAATLLKRRMGGIGVAACGCLAGIAYYTVLNILMLPGFPWAVFPAYALFWWPLAAAFARPGRSLPLAIAGSLLSAAFFVAVNFITTPGSVWCVYPMFALSWWPLSVYYFIYKRRRINA